MQPGRFPRSSRTQKEERPVAPFQIACRCCPYDWRQKGGWRYTASVARIGKPGGLTLSQLPHHRTYGSVYGGSGRTRKSPALTVKAHEILVTQHPSMIIGDSSPAVSRRAVSVWRASPVPSAVPPPTLRGRSGISAILSAPSSDIERVAPVWLFPFGPSPPCAGGDYGLG